MKNSKIITIDGPSGVGKGTLAKNLADELDWIVLDSGSLYRMVGYLSLHLDTKDFSDIREKISKEEIFFKFIDKNSNISLFLGEVDLSEFIRNEEVAKLASEFAVLPEVRDYLFNIQRGFAAKGKGLIADGRDMGTIVFPEAKHKFFITASAEERARRRENQLKESGLSVNMRILQERIEERDNKDSSREISPLIPAEDAVVIDSSNIGIYELKDMVLKLIRS